MEDLTIMFIGMIQTFMQQNLTLFIVVCIFILLDVVSGCVVGFVNHNFSSTELRKGLGHKIAYIFLLCAVAVLQVAMFDPNFSLNFDFPLFNIACGFIIFMEFVSILENVTTLNPGLDSFLGKYFDKKNDENTVNVTQHFGKEEIENIPMEFRDVF